MGQQHELEILKIMQANPDKEFAPTELRNRINTDYTTANNALIDLEKGGLIKKVLIEKVRWTLNENSKTD